MYMFVYVCVYVCVGKGRCEDGLRWNRERRKSQGKKKAETKVRFFMAVGGVDVTQRKDGERRTADATQSATDTSA